MKSFFPMRRREGATLVFLIAFAVFAFIPAWRTVELGGMAVFGWLIATLMVVSPAVTIVAFRRRRGGASAPPDDGRADEAIAEAESDSGAGQH